MGFSGVTSQVKQQTEAEIVMAVETKNEMRKSIFRLYFTIGSSTNKLEGLRYKCIIFPQHA